MAYSDIEKRNEWFRKRYQDNLEFVQNYKMKIGCSDCGWNEHHAGLEFDHVNPHVRGTVSSQLGKSRRVILEEISACEVVCSRCHSLRTWNRRAQMVQE